MRWFSLLLIAALILPFAGQAEAHAPGAADVKSAGMLSFTAQAGLATPANNAVGVADPVSVTSDSDHFVRVSAAGGGGGGSQVTISYNLSVGLNGYGLGNPKGGTNQQVTLDAEGKWEKPGDFSREGPKVAGVNTADATAWIEMSATPSTTHASKYHSHNFQ